MQYGKQQNYKSNQELFYYFFSHPPPSLPPNPYNEMKQGILMIGNVKLIMKFLY